MEQCVVSGKAVAAAKEYRHCNALVALHPTTTTSVPPHTTLLQYDNPSTLPHSSLPVARHPTLPYSTAQQGHPNRPPCSINTLP